MARRRSEAKAAAPNDVELRQVIAWYEEQLELATPPADLVWEPVKIGPTWQYDNGWILPEFTLGWKNLGWAGLNLSSPKGSGPMRYTLEQARFILWQDAIDPDTGEFLFPFSVLQRLKGWGKDPLAVAVSMTDICSEHAAFSHFDGGEPIGQPTPNAYVQIVGVAQDQIKRNTMPLFHSMVPLDTRRKYGVQIGKLDVWAKGDTAHIEAPTSSTMALEGPRPTRVIRNETQNWVAGNGGHELAGAIEGNLAKSEGGAARQLDICNAHVPGRSSVAEATREGWESTQGEEAIESYGMLYDSLEAPPNAPLTIADAPSVVESVRGDSVWLSTKRILDSIKNPNNSASESRRKWYNQVTGTEDAWADPRWVDACNVNRGKKSEDREVIADGEPVVMFGDGSKSNDGTGLVIARVSDGFAETFHYQLPGKNEDGRPRLVNRNLVDVAVDEAFERFKIVAFFFDPSHAKADDAIEDDRFWWPLCDHWHEKYGKRLKVHAVASGPRKHSIAFDMLKPAAQQLFQPAVSQVREELQAGTAIHNGNAELRRHMKNARLREGRYGMSLGKEHRSSKRKVDLAVCFVGARMLRRMVRLANKQGTPGKGRVILLD